MIQKGSFEMTPMPGEALWICNDFLKKSFVFILLTGLFLMPCPGAATEEKETAASGESKVFSLGETVVTAEKATAQKVVTVTEITREDFQLRGVNTVADALRYIPGDWSLFHGGHWQETGNRNNCVAFGDLKPQIS